MSESPDNIQHGGDHYVKIGEHQHWNMLPICGFGWEYYIGRATAYLTRVKEPQLDRDKAVHFIDKLISLVEQKMVPATLNSAEWPKVASIEQYLRTVYFPANHIERNSTAAKLITALMTAHTLDDLRAARRIAEEYERRPSPAETTKAYSNWPFSEPDPEPTTEYVDQDRTPPEPELPFASGQGGDFAGAGATSSYAEPATDNSCRASDYSSSSSDSSSSSSSSDSSSSPSSSD